MPKLDDNAFTQTFDKTRGFYSEGERQRSKKPAKNRKFTLRCKTSISTYTGCLTFTWTKIELTLATGPTDLTRSLLQFFYVDLGGKEFPVDNTTVDYMLHTWWAYGGFHGDSETASVYNLQLEPQALIVQEWFADTSNHGQFGAHVHICHDWLIQ